MERFINPNVIDDHNKHSSMGIYVINRDVLIKLLSKYFPKANDFGSEVIPGAISMGMKVRLFVPRKPFLFFVSDSIIRLLLLLPLLFSTYEILSLQTRVRLKHICMMGIGRT